MKHNLNLIMDSLSYFYAKIHFCFDVNTVFHLSIQPLHFKLVTHPVTGYAADVFFLNLSKVVPAQPISF